jgi:uncharacterized protein (DUF302 family)
MRGATMLIHFSGLAALIVLGLGRARASNSDQVQPKPTITTAAVTHLNYRSSKPFDAVCAAIEHQLGRFDAAALAPLLSSGASAADIDSKIHAMEGPNGLMLFAVRDHGQLLSLAGKNAYARQYELGNPLIAREMTQVDLRSGEYAPLRILVYVSADKLTHVDYDLPSTVFGRFQSPDVDKVATGLDHKLEVLVTNALKN